MKAVFLSVAAALLLASSIEAQTPLVINTPTAPVVCQPLLITWSGGTPPYFLSILPGNQPGGPALLDFGQVVGTQLTWTLNIAPGTSLLLTLRDSTGVLAQSAPFTVQPGSDTSCLNPSSSTTSHSTSTRPHTSTSGSSRGSHTSSSASHRTSTTSHSSVSTPRPPSLTLSQPTIPVTSTPTLSSSGSSDTTNSNTDPSTPPTAPTTLSGTSPAASTTPSTSSASAAGIVICSGFARCFGLVVSAAVMVLIL